MCMNIFKRTKDKVVGKLLEKQLKNVPKEQREMILQVVQKNPDFFKKIAKEVEEEKKKGNNEMYATMTVMKRHEAELQKLMQS
jgi:hypothetical protein